MLRLHLSKAQGRKDFWKPSKPCHVGIHWKALAEFSQMSTHVSGFLSFFMFLHHFVMAKSATSSIRVKGYACGKFWSRAREHIYLDLCRSIHPIHSLNYTHIIQSSVYTSIHTPICSFISPFIHLAFCLCVSIHTSTQLSIRHPPIRPYIHTFIHTSILFIHLCIPSFTHSFIYSFIHSFTHLSIHST